MSCPCCPRTTSPCDTSCGIPLEIIIELTLGELVSTVYPISEADISTVEAAINGTYSLSYTGYFSGRARYRANYGSPFLDPFAWPADFMFDWNCTSASGFSAFLIIRLCRSIDFAYFGYDKNLTSGGIQISDDTLPTITSYCDGDSFGTSLTANLFARPQTSCGAQPGVGDQSSAFLLDVDVSI